MSETSPSAKPFACLLPNRAVIAVGGREAGHFLHNLLTANIEGLTPGGGVPAALLTPQGKIILDMLVFNASDEEPLFLIDVVKGLADDLIRRLTIYRLRSEVSIDRLPDEVGVAALSGPAPAEAEDFYAFADPRDAGLGHRLIGPLASLRQALPDGGAADDTGYQAARIALGLPECGKDYLPLAVFPHEVNLDQIGGIDFRKGCYIGQEVVSRMEHRGTARTRTLIARLDNGINVAGGTECRSGEILLGTGGECHGGHGLVVIRLDKLSELVKASAAVTLGGVPVQFSTPHYAKFQF